MATSYSNPGGTGNRTFLILVKTDLSWAAGGYPSQILEALTSGWTWWGSQAAAGKSVTFDFGAPRVVDEATWSQDVATTHGTWQWQGSHDDALYIDIGPSFTLGGIAQVQTALNGNMLAFRYYRLLGLSGNASSTPFLKGIEFRLDPPVSTVCDYANPYGAGDRIATVTVTQSLDTGGLGNIIFGQGASNSPHLSLFVDNLNRVDAGADRLEFQTADPTVAGKWIQFQFPTQQVIDQVRWFQNLTDTHGVWKLQGSNDGSTFTDIGVSATLGGGFDALRGYSVFNGPNGNTTAYFYYRLTGVSGNASGNPFLYEIAFRISPGLAGFTAAPYYYRITVDHTLCGASDSANFALLVRVQFWTMKYAAYGGHVQNVNAYDVIFANDQSGMDKIPWEILFYDPINGILRARVRRNISYTVDDVFYMCFGNPSLSTPQNTGSFAPQNVWDTPTRGMWHFENGVATDSSSYANHGTKVNGPAPTSSGKNGGALSFVAANDQYVEVAQNASLDISGAISISCWYDLFSSPGSPTLLSHYNTNSPRKGYELGWSFQSPTFEIANGTGSGGRNGSGISRAPFDPSQSLGALHHVVCVFDGANTARIYADGQIMYPSHPLNEFTDFGGLNGAAGIPLRIGVRTPASSTGWQGLLQRVRISATVRSADWVTQTYNSESDPGNVVVPAAFTVATGNPASFHSVGHNLIEGQRIYITTTGTLSGIDPAPAAYYVRVTDADNFHLSTEPTGGFLAIIGGTISGVHTFHPANTFLTYGLESVPSNQGVAAETSPRALESGAGTVHVIGSASEVAPMSEELVIAIGGTPVESNPAESPILLHARWRFQDELLHGYDNTTQLWTDGDLVLGLANPSTVTAPIEVSLRSSAALIGSQEIFNRVRFYLDGSEAHLRTLLTDWPAVNAGVEISFDNGMSWIRFNTDTGNPAAPVSWIPLPAGAVSSVAQDGRIGPMDVAVLHLRMVTPPIIDKSSLFRMRLGIDCDVL